MMIMKIEPIPHNTENQWHADRSSGFRLIQSRTVSTLLWRNTLFAINQNSDLTPLRTIQPNKPPTTEPTMTTKFIPTIGIITVLFAANAVAQQKQEKHPEAEKAMAKIVLQKDFGDKLKFHSREVVTLAENKTSPGLNGLMFMRWKGDGPDSEVEASVQWFEKKEDLLKFYAATTKQEIYKLGDFEGTPVWKMNEDGFAGYSWTDGEHFLVSLGGAPPPPPEMVKAWLAMIDSKVAEVEKKGEKGQVPADPPKK